MSTPPQTLSARLRRCRLQGGSGLSLVPRQLVEDAAAELDRHDAEAKEYGDAVAKWRPIVTAAEGLRAAQRYELTPNYRCGGVIDEMERHDYGDWVRWEAIEALLALLPPPEATQE